MNVLTLLVLLIFLIPAQTVPLLDLHSDHTGPGDFTARFQPQPLLAGDVVTVEVFGQEGVDLTDHTVEVSVIYPISKSLGTATFYPGGYRPMNAVLAWAWETEGLSPGVYVVQFRVQPGETSWSEVVRLHAPPEEDPESEWSTAETECCNIHYITGTRPARELPGLAAMVEEQARLASERMGAPLPERIEISFLPRVLGHGGFAGEELYISYADINYTNIDLAVVVHHELIHRIDRELGGDHRPSIFVEGLAVYMSGGHYKEEDLMARASALLALDAFLPLTELANDFYTAQHESGYLQAGALVQYMVDTYGWDAFSQFYRDIQAPEDGEDSGVIDSALQQHFRVSFSELEDQFISFLQAQPVEQDVLADVRLTIEYYDTLREYQQRLDSTAYFRLAWLPSGEEMREKGIVADYLRRPLQPQNLVIEQLIAQAGQHMTRGEYDAATQALQLVHNLLPQIPSLQSSPARFLTPSAWGNKQLSLSPGY